MLFLPLMAIAVITFLVPWLQVALVGWDLSLPRLANTVQQFLHLGSAPGTGSGTGCNCSANITDPLSNSQSQVVYDPLLEHEKSLSLSPTDLIDEVDGLVAEVRQRLFKVLVDAYSQAAPDSMVQRIDQFVKLIKEHRCYQYYKSQEALIKNVLFMMILIVIVKLLVSGVNSLLSQRNQPPQPTLNISKIPFDNDQKYLDFATIPICVGKGDFEEEQILNSYQELYERTHDVELLRQFETEDIDYDTNMNVNMSMNMTINSLDGESTSSSSILDKQSQPSESGERSTFEKPSTPNSSTPENSFEREERRLDKNLSRLNDEKTSISSTPRSIISSDLPTFGSSSSPSKLLFNKRSFTILTATATPAPLEITTSSTTVGDITEETVYSEPFSSDDTNVTPIETILR